MEDDSCSEWQKCESLMKFDMNDEKISKPIQHDIFANVIQLKWN